MKKRIFFYLLCIFLSFGKLFAASLPADENPKNIFVLISYHLSQQWSNDLFSGFFDYTKNSARNLYIEQLDAKRFPLNEERRALFIENFNELYSDIDFDLVLLLDNSALKLINDNWTELPFLHGAKILAGGINAYDTAMICNIPQTIVIEEKSYHFDNVNEIRRLFPETKNIYCLIDHTLTGNVVRDDFMESLHEHELPADLAITFSKKGAFEATMTEISELPEQTVILILTYNRDGENRYIPTEKLMTRIAKVTDKPIFLSFDFYFSEKCPNIVGGKVLNGSRQGEILGVNAERLLRGDFPAEGTPQYDEFEWCFTYSAVEKYDLEDMLPEGSIIINQPKPFFEKYQWLPVTLLIISILAVLTIILFYIFNIALSQQLRLRTRAIKTIADKMEFLIENLPSGYIEVNSNDEIVVWNPYAEKIFGFKASEVLNKNIFMLLIAPEHHSKVREMKQRHLDNNTNGTIEIKNITKKKKIIDCEWFFTVQRDDNWQPIRNILIVNDITKKVRTKREREQLIENMKQMMLDQDRFMATSMHDLKNLLAPITAYTELLCSDELPPEKGKEVAVKLNNSLSTLTKTFIEMMNISKAKGELMSVQPRTFNLHTLIETAAGMLEELLRSKNITFRNDISPDQTIFADYNMTYSILTNLIGNAIKFTPEHGHISIFGKTVDTNMFEVSVRDDGMGIDEGKFQKMMEKNRYFSTAGTNGEKGTGLGLMLVKSLIANHGGVFTAVRNPEGGSTFSFTLPRVELPQK